MAARLPARMLGYVLNCVCGSMMLIPQWKFMNVEDVAFFQPFAAQCWFSIFITEIEIEFKLGKRRDIKKISGKSLFRQIWLSISIAGVFNVK